MKKPIPKKPVKVSKAKKTLPVEIDWGSGMRDRLRYISPAEEEMIRRNRSTDAERYYGGIRAYPDPGDTAAGDSLGVTSGTTTGTTVSNSGTSGGSDAGSSTGGGSDSGGSVGSSMGGATSSTATSAAGGVGSVAGGDSGAVTASAAAEPSYTGGMQAGVGSAEGALKGTEDSYRNGGIGSLDSGRITSISNSSYAEPQNSYNSYSTNNTPNPVTAGPVTSSLYGNDVPDEAVPGANQKQPENQYVTAADSLRGMLTRGGAYVGPSGGVVGSTATLEQVADRTYGTPSTMASESTLDRLANGNSVIGNTEADGKRTPKIADRVGDGGIADLGDDTDTKRGVSTVSTAEGIPAPQVALGISAPVPQTPATALPNASMSQGAYAWNDAYKTNPMTYTPPADVAAQGGIDSIDPNRETQAFKTPSYEKVLEVDTLPPETTRKPTEVNIGGAGLPVAQGPAVPRNFSPPPVSESGVPPGTLPVSQLPSGMYSIAAIDERNRRMEAASRGAGIDSLDTQPRDYEANADVYTGGVEDLSPSQDERTIPSQEGENGLVGDDARRAAKEAGLPRDLYSRDDFAEDPNWVGLGSGQVEQEDVTPEDSAKVVSKYLSQRYPDDYKTYLTPAEKERYIASEAVKNAVYRGIPVVGGLAKRGIESGMDIQGTRDFLGEPSWAQDTRYDLAKDSAERYGRTNLQGDRAGGSGNNNIVVDDPTARAVSQYSDWINGRNIPDKSDPDYPAYMYFVSKMGIERQGSGDNWGNGWDSSDSEWGWS